MPGRARTTSEGAHHLTHHAPVTRHLAPSHSHSRPHSMYLRGISYSPPVGSTPVSPASGACSTDSAGSSLSMDGDTCDGAWCLETEPRYGHSLTPEEPVIMEENPDDYGPWPGNQSGENDNLNNYMLMERSICLPIQPNTTSVRKFSPNLGGKSSSPSQNSFMDVYSPCGSSPLENSGAYMPMSPGDTRAAYNRAGSANHSRGSSLAEDGYVPMAPGAHDDGYVDMDHGNSSGKRGGSSGSSCSITSGTPSTDIRFSEYNLERVSTLISQDDEPPNERPARAYSVGSRPVNINNLSARTETNIHSEPQRVRAFSVGSRGPRARPGLHSHLTPPTRNSSHSSVEPSEDLMELDFSKNNKSRTRSKNPFKKPATSVSSERLTLPSGSGVSSAASSYSTAEGSYMEMSPRSSPKPSDLDIDMTHLAPSPPKNNRFATIFGRSPPKTGFQFERKMGFLSSSPPISHSSPPLYRVPEGDSGYVEMTTGSGDELHTDESTVVNDLSSSQRTTSRPKSPENNDEYLEMKPGGEAKPVLPKSAQPRVEMFPVNKPQHQHFTPMIKQPLLTSQNIVRARGSLQEDYLDMSQKRKMSLVENNNNTAVLIERTASVDTTTKTPEGYVEMSWSKNKSQRKGSIEEGKCENEDYLNMGGGIVKQNRRGSKKDRNRHSSQPIAIQPPNKEGSTTSPVFPFCGRKHSTGTPPKVPCFLPLNSYGSSSPSSSPFSSLGRNRGRKIVRRDSKESNTGSGLTTPSSGSTTTIFPLNLNSPGSPMKPFTAKQEYELSMCPVDASSGTVKLTEPDTSSKHLSVSIENDYVNFMPGAHQESSDHEKLTASQEPCNRVTATSQEHSDHESAASEESLKRLSAVSEESFKGLSSVNEESSKRESLGTKKEAVVVKPSQADSTKKPPMDRLLKDMSNMSLKNTGESVCEVSTRLSESNISEVTSERAGNSVAVSRTSSVSSVGEKELHYASLDLVRSSSEDDTGQTRSLKSQTSLTESSSTSTPSPNPNLSGEPSFTYAEIDFVASQKLLRH